VRIATDSRRGADNDRQVGIQSPMYSYYGYVYWFVCISTVCNYEINATSHTAVRCRVLMKNEQFVAIRIAIFDSVDSF